MSAVRVERSFRWSTSCAICMHKLNYRHHLRSCTAKVTATLCGHRSLMPPSLLSLLLLVYASREETSQDAAKSTGCPFLIISSRGRDRRPGGTRSRGRAQFMQMSVSRSKMRIPRRRSIGETELLWIRNA
jgi:hypothetical protein